MKNIDEKIRKAILKKATGYETSETVEEYQDTDDGLILTKKKVTKKHVPPDTQAVKMLLELDEEKDIKSLTDEELEAEKLRLLNILKEYDYENK